MLTPLMTRLTRLFQGLIDPLHITKKNTININLLWGEKKIYAKFLCFRHVAVKGTERAEVLGNSIGEPHMTFEKKVTRPFQKGPGREYPRPKEYPEG